MKFFIIHVDGTEESDPPMESLEALHDELNGDGAADDKVSVVGRMGKILTLERRRVLIWEIHPWRLRTRHMVNVAKRRVLNAFQLLAHGDDKAVDRRPWWPGEPPAAVVIRVPDPRAELVERGKAVHRVVGQFLNVTYSDFELAYLRRGDGEESLEYWERIAVAYQCYTRGRLLTEPQEQKLFCDLREMATDEARTLAVGYAYWDELTAAFGEAERLGHILLDSGDERDEQPLTTAGQRPTMPVDGQAGRVEGIVVRSTSSDSINPQEAIS